MSLTQDLARELREEAVMTRSLLASIPQDKLGFSAGGGLHTVGWNAAHLASMIGWPAGILTHSEMDLEKEPPTPEATDVAEVLRDFDQNLAETLAVLDKIPEATLSEPWTMRYGPQVLFTTEKGACIRKWVVTHTAHHRGILSAQLRLAGVDHGSIYEG